MLGTIACAGAAYGVRALNFWTLSGSVAVLSFAPILTLPSFLARLLYVVGQASFAIFLLHVIYLRVYEKILKLQDPDLAWLFAMVFSTLTWIVGTAALARIPARCGQSGRNGYDPRPGALLCLTPQPGEAIIFPYRTLAGGACRIGLNRQNGRTHAGAFLHTNREGNMPFVSIRIVKEVLARTPRPRRPQSGGKVARAISEATGLPASEVSIVFEEVEARNWYVGEIDVETRRRAMKSG